jgi:hypothetical protein
MKFEERTDYRVFFAFSLNAASAEYAKSPGDAGAFRKRIFYVVLPINGRAT